jgi:hypothetical protein
MRSQTGAVVGILGRVMGIFPKEKPARNQDAFPKTPIPSGPKTGAKQGGVAAPVMEAMTVTERLRQETVTR